MDDYVSLTRMIIKLENLLHNIQTTYYLNNDFKKDIRPLILIALDIQDYNNNKNTDINAAEFKEKINKQDDDNLSSLKNLPNEKINELFKQKGRKRKATQPAAQSGGGTEENMNPVIYAGVSILVLLGALTGLKM